MSEQQPQQQPKSREQLCRELVRAALQLQSASRQAERRTVGGERVDELFSKVPKADHSRNSIVI